MSARGVIGVVAGGREDEDEDEDGNEDGDEDGNV